MVKQNVQRQKPVPAHVTHHLTAHPKSGKTIAAYCRDARISAWSFYNWRKIYGKRVNTPNATGTIPIPQPSLPPFTVLGKMSTQIRQPLFDIRLSAETRISIYSGATARELAPFLELLSYRGASC